MNFAPPYRAYRFWPVYAAAFTRTFSYAIYNLALPNYLVYFKHISADLLGIIVSILSFTYIAGPLLALQVTKHIGLKNTVVISAVGSFSLVAVQIIFLGVIADVGQTFGIIIFLRGLDGIITGFYWPNVQMEVSNWQRAGPPGLADKYFQKYGLSWNVGILAGDIAGYIIVFSGHGNEFLALIISAALMATMIPATLKMERPDCIAFDGNKGIVYLEISDATNRPANPLAVSEEASKPALGNARIASPFLLAFPALFYLLGTMAYAYTKNLYPLIVPLAYNAATIPSSMVYLITFFYQSIAMFVIMAWSRLSAKSGYYTWLIAMIANAGFLAWLWAFPNVISLTIAFLANGALSGWLYNFTSKIMLEYGAATNSLKYATYYEFYNGIGFAASPLLAGFIADTSLALNYPVNLVIVAVFIVVLLILGKNARKFLKNGK